MVKVSKCQWGLGCLVRFGSRMAGEGLIKLLEIDRDGRDE